MFMLAVSLPSISQGLRFTPFGGYTFQDKIYGYNGDVTIKDGAHYGAVLSMEKSSQMRVDLTYSGQQTTFKVTDFYPGAGNLSGDYKGSVHYIMLGATHSPDFQAKVAPYGGMMLGAAIFTPKGLADYSRFAIGGKLGAIIHANDKIGIVLQTQLMVPVQSIYFGTGGIGAGGTAIQFGFTGGLEFKLGN